MISQELRLPTAIVEGDGLAGGPAHHIPVSAGRKVAQGEAVAVPRGEDLAGRREESEDELLVAGCPDGGSAPKVSVYPLDGAASRTLLDDSAPDL